MTGRPPVPLPDRFWPKVVKAGPDDCWLWTGASDKDGYGFIKRKDGVQLRAHRVSFELDTGEEAGDSFICHSCDTPQCVNPAHLFRADPLVNMTDKVSKGRLVSSPGEKNGAAILRDCEALVIKRSLERTAYLAAIYGVSIATIQMIRSGRSWKHLSS